jgi:CO/xanthine dehydrogenase Mo-binding subunit
MAVYKVIGQPGLLDKQAAECVTGKIEIANDVWMGQKLIAKVLGSPHAHAKIKSIDVAAALALKGVEAIVDYTEVAGWSDTLYCIGAPIAAVAAVDEDTCFQAMKLIKVEYEILPGVISPDDAIKPNAPLVGLWPDGNMHERTNVKWGDVDNALKDADVVVSDVSGWSTKHFNQMIGGGNCTAWWVGDELYAWVDTQNPHGEHSGFAGSLKMPHNRIRVFTHGNGGGFGSGRVNAQMPAAALAKKTGKVVSLFEDKNYQFSFGQHQFALRSDIQIGAKKDGTITAIKAQYWGDQGTTTSTPLTDCHLPLAITFNSPNASYVVNGILTNTAGSSYYRCVAHPGGAFLMNIAVTKMAEKLNMDPLEFRLKNLVQPGSKDLLTGNVHAMCTIKETLQAAADAVGYASKKHAPGARTLADGRKHGIAVTGHLDGHGGYSPGRGAIITLRKDGTCYINAGISRVGPGTNTAHCHFVAETLGLKYDDVRVGDYGNTAVTADGGMQAGSTNTTCTGAAFTMAARDALVQVKQTAAAMFTPAVTPEDLDVGDSKVFLKSDPTKFKTYAEVCARNGFIIGRGVAWPATLQRAVGNSPVGTPCTQRPACAAAAEVAVDTDTGIIEILSYAGVTDVGQIVYNQGMYAQAEAGIEHMLAQGIYWDIIVDSATGAVLNPCFLNHRYPTSLDLPLDKMSPVVLEGNSAVGPYGATGSGEPVSSNYAAISQAVYNAIGVWITDSPMHPWKILKALGKV